MAEKNEGHPWLWVIIVFAIILLGYYFASVIPEDSTSNPIAGTGEKSLQETDRSHDAMTVVSQAIIGTWRSSDDQKFTRQFSDDGTVIDMYEGDPNATAHGSWSVFSAPEKDAEFSGAAAPGVVYLKIVEGGAPMFFSIITAAGDTLQLTYLDRGSELDFSRVQ
ncbi:MAG: hypothetical protein RLZZ416_234 [Candidatus Parcubacteria bacterium]|jgi:hypothetical protein